MPQLDPLALLAEHAGIWEGEYTHIDPADRSVQQRLTFRIRVDCPAGGDVDYRQTSHYWFEDGTEQELVYEGRMRDGRLAIVDGRHRAHLALVPRRGALAHHARAGAAGDARSGGVVAACGRTAAQRPWRKSRNCRSAGRPSCHSR